MAILVLVEDVEDVIREFAWVAEGEELLVYSAEFRLVELSTRTVLQEALVPSDTGRGMRGLHNDDREGNKSTIVVALAYRLIPQLMRWGRTKALRNIQYVCF